MIIFESLKGQQYDPSEFGVHCLDFVIDSPEILTDYEKIDGGQGSIALEASYGPRKIKGSFYAHPTTNEEYAYKRDQIFRLFGTLDSFFLIEKRRPEKRWKVKTQGAFRLEQDWKYGFFDVEFVSESPYSHSIYMDEKEFTANTFDFYNPGDITVDPRFHLEMTISIEGVTNGISITNYTTGETWSYSGDTQSGDKLVLKGVRCTKNNVSVFKDTNKKLLKLVPGINSFTVTGKNLETKIIISTRFYYL